MAISAPLAKIGVKSRFTPVLHSDFLLPCSYPAPGNEPKMWSRYNNEEECVANGGTWFTEYGYIDTDSTANNMQTCADRNSTLPRGYSTRWARPSWDVAAPRCLIIGPPPECTSAGWSRVNHLGNGRDGVPLNYTWTIPHFLRNRDKLAIVRIR